MTAKTLEEVAARIAEVLGEEDCVLVGGLAVGAHGYVRATTDVDFVVRDLEAASKRLREQRLPVERFRGDFTCLRGTIGDIRFDVLPALVPIQWDRAIAVPLGTGSIRVIDLGSLLRLKLKAGGSKDLMDVAALLLLHPERQERARELSVAYGVRDKLDVWLRDPRLQAEIVEARAAESGRRQRGKLPIAPAPARRARKTGRE